MPNNQRSFYRRLFPTAHKLLLNRIIQSELLHLAGDVLVIGAGKEPYRDLLTNAASVCVTDIGELHDGLDMIADAHHLPFEPAQFDAIVAVEVFEHLERPSIASAELLRVLRPGGRAIVSMPFMFRVHGDPYDYQRLTDSGLRALFAEFSDCVIMGFGGRRHVVSDIVSTIAPPFAALRILNHLLAASRFGPSASPDCPSGYVVNLVKRMREIG